MSTARFARPGFIQGLLNSMGSGARPQAAVDARIMVVDDSPTIRAVLGTMLMQELYQVITAPEGHKAIITAIREQPALIFLDVVMPGLNGFDVLRALRHDARTQNIPVILMSGNAQANEQLDLQHSGADAFMKKPFGGDEVCHCIEQLVLTGRLAPRAVTDAGLTPANMPPAAEVHDASPAVTMPYAEMARGLGDRHL